MSAPRVGVGVFVFGGPHGDRFIIGRRKGSLGAGSVALPGGHLEHGESFADCAAREVLEETGLVVATPTFLTATNSVFHDAAKHYVTIFMTVRIIGNVAEPKVLEPEKCEGWSWSTFTGLRDMRHNPDTPLFQPLADLMDSRIDVCHRLEHWTQADA